MSGFADQEITKSCEMIHSTLDEIEKIHGLYSPGALALAAALACGSFTFLLGGGVIEMLCAFIVQVSAIIPMQRRNII